MYELLCIYFIKVFNKTFELPSIRFAYDTRHVITNINTTTENKEMTNNLYKMLWVAVADPGFPVGGGVDLIGGAVDPRGGYVSKILHVKTKESGPMGGGARAGRAPPRSANGLQTKIYFEHTEANVAAQWAHLLNM